jgi:hypothetical protein
MPEEKVRPTRWSAAKRSASVWWTLVKDEDFGAGVLVEGCDGERILPVFSGEDEAEMFVWLGGAFEDGWRVRETSAGELVSMLYGPCAHVRRVALDPSPEMPGMGAVDLVSVTRERFLSWIADRQRPSDRNRARRATLGGR